MSALTIFTFLITCAQCYSKFHTTCTTPSSRTNYVSSPDTRGTLDILWSCFFTIIACTWTIQHLNVPEQPSSEFRDLPWYSYRGLMWNLKGPQRTARWMLVTMIAPEYILGKALADLYAAYQSKKKMQGYAHHDGVGWGLKHGFFANMGGFVLGQNLNEMSDSRVPVSGLDTEASCASPQNLEKAVESQAPEIAPGKLDDPGLLEDGQHESASVSKTEDDGGEDVSMRLPEISSEGIATKPEDKILPCAPEVGVLRKGDNPEEQKALKNSQTRPKGDFKETLATASVKHARYSLPKPKDLPFTEEKGRISSQIKMPPKRRNKKAIGPKDFLPKRADLRRAAASRRESRKQAMKGDNIWESRILKEAGAPSYEYIVPFHLLASEIFALRHNGALAKLPNITSAEIADKSKNDAFVKLVASFQVLWFILQVIVRAAQGLSISQLEIAVTAFGICAIITYLLLLPKPKSVDVPITLMEFQDHIPIDEEKFKVPRERILQGYVRAMFVPRDDLVNEVEVIGSHIPNDALDLGMELIVLHVGVSIGGIIFGAIHITAWNLSFPTLIEQTLWRTASIMATALPPVMYLGLLIEQFFLRDFLPTKLIKFWDIFFGALYVVARAFLLVEIFRTLLFLPEGAYVTTWASNVPHVS